MRLSQLVALAVLATTPTWARACWEDAAQRYGVSADLLYAMAQVESNLNTKAVNRSHIQRSSSYDIGLMQVNSSHLSTLSRYGIKEADLFNPCTNIQVGAWLLADLFSRHGATWDAVGAYNASCSQLKNSACTTARAKYAWQVYRQLPAQRRVRPATEMTAIRPTNPTKAFARMSAKVSP